MDPHLSFPVVVPERIEIKSEKEETNTENHLTTIKKETDSFPVCGFPVVVLESLEIKSEKEEPNAEEHLTTKSDTFTFPVSGPAKSCIHSLISEVFKRDPLWNQRSKFYHDRSVHVKLWKDIAAVMDAPWEVCKTKWKNLRDAFRRELKKVNGPRSGDAGPSSEVTSTWPFYTRMLFLQDQMMPARTSSNLENCFLTLEPAVDESVEEVAADEKIHLRSNSLEPPAKKSKNAFALKRELVAIEAKKLELLSAAYTAETDSELSFLKSLLPFINELDLDAKLKLRKVLTDDVVAAVLEFKSHQKNN